MNTFTKAVIYISLVACKAVSYISLVAFIVFGFALLVLVVYGIVLDMFFPKV